MERMIRLGITAFVLVSPLFLAGCGDDDDPPQQQQGPPPPAGSRLWVVPDGAAVLTAGQRAAFTAGNLYYNAHTSANQSGEIRGQLDKEGTVRFASLDGAQEVPAVTTNGRGWGALSVNETSGAVSGFVVTTGLTGANLAHVHVGARGASPPGNVVIPLSGGPDVWFVPDGAAALTTAQIADFLAGNYYFNVHTPTNPNGEIRGQIDKDGTAKLASLTGGQEVPANTSAGYGGGILVVEDGTGEVSGFVVSSGLTGANNAHVHIAPRGQSPAGNVITPMVGGPNVWIIPDTATALDPTQRQAFTDDGLYYNVHTPAIPAGEIRGQVDKTGTLRFTSLTGGQEVPAVQTTATGAAVAAVDGTSGEVSGFLMTTGLSNPTVAHIHEAARGASAGPIVNLAP
jgi:hypothetical protein